MQLSALLARLTPEERSVLLERRLGENTVALDNQALTNQLVQPVSLRFALAELNVGQLLLLRWLGTRPNLEATWAELLAALGDRIAPGLRDAYLLDLRLWGLADYHPTQRGGFFATYPAVVAHLPNPRGIKLRQRLQDTSTDYLARIAGALGLSNPPTKKDGRIGLIMAALAETEPCRQAVERLSEQARALFEWVREHGGSVTAQEMGQRAPRTARTYGSYYGSVGDYWRPVPRGETLDPLSELVRSCLVLPTSPYAGAWYGATSFAIPEEVETAYSGRTLLDSAPMQPPPLEQADQLAGTIPNPANVLRDLAHLLGFVAAGRCEWRQDGGPYKRSLVALGKMLGSPNADYPEALWGMAVAAVLLQPVRGGRGGYTAAIGVDASPRELMDGLLLGWVQAGGQSFQTGVTPGAAEAARVHLLELLRIMPVDTWVLQRSVEAWLRFHWPVLFSPDFQMPYTSPPDSGMASLGNFLLARGSTPDGQEAVMIPAAHQKLLELAEPGSPAASSGESDGVLPPWDESWIVQPDRSIIAPPNASPNALLDLWKVAQLESNQGASVFRITAESIAAALNHNVSPAEIRTLLEKRSRVPLPPTVQRLIDDQGQRYGRIKVGTAQTYVQVDDPALLAELRRDKRLQKLDWRDAAPGVAFVVSSEPAAVLETLRKAGYLPVLDQARPKKAGQIQAVQSPASRGGNQSLNRGKSTADGMLRLARTALREERLLYVTWTDGASVREGELEMIDLHGRVIHANNLDDGEDVMVPADNIIEAELGDPLDDDVDLSFLDD